MKDKIPDTFSRAERDARDLAIINQHAERLNAEALDALAYQCLEVLPFDLNWQHPEKAPPIVSVVQRDLPAEASTPESVKHKSHAKALSR